VSREENPALAWQSKAILLLVVPWTALSVLFQTIFWAQNAPVVAWTTLGISAAFGLIVWRMKAGTPAAAATGAAITASLMYNTARYPYATSWLHGGLLPLLAVFLLTYAATKIGKSRKEKLGTGESKRGRNAAQVAANIGASALFASMPISAFSPERILLPSLQAIVTFAALTALSEAAADTVSSEIGQVFGGEPRLITTMRRVPKGTDGGITVTGTFAGSIAALIVMTVGFWAMRGTDKFLGYWVSICLGTACGIFGLLFDSLLGVTLERKGWLNNDAVNFLSTLSAVIFPAVLAGGIMAEIMRRHPAW
jgi:uncharacterized protein (TIGR00297 family)